MKKVFGNLKVYLIVMILILMIFFNGCATTGRISEASPNTTGTLVTPTAVAQYTDKNYCEKIIGNEEVKCKRKWYCVWLCKKCSTNYCYKFDWFECKGFLYQSCTGKIGECEADWGRFGFGVQHYSDANFCFGDPLTFY
jgi:hypothetical protein